MNKSSTWMALQNPAFRKLWIATVISGTCVAAHDSAATWIMNIFTGSPFCVGPALGGLLVPWAGANFVFALNAVCFLLVVLATRQALGGVIWGSATAMAGASYTLLGAALLSLTSLLLASRLSSNVSRNLEEKVSGFLSGSVKPEGVTRIAATNELLAA